MCFNVCQRFNQQHAGVISSNELCKTQSHMVDRTVDLYYHTTGRRGWEEGERRRERQTAESEGNTSSLGETCVAAVKQSLFRSLSRFTSHDYCQLISAAFCLFLSIYVCIYMYRVWCVSHVCFSSFVSLMMSVYNSIQLSWSSFLTSFHDQEWMLNFYF